MWFDPLTHKLGLLKDTTKWEQTICLTQKIVDVPDGIVHISNGLFATGEMKQINLPHSLRAIGDGGFENCKHLREITLPRNLTSIGEGAFRGCSQLRAITIPPGIINLPPGVFSGCRRLQKVGAGSILDTVDSTAFVGCCKLTEISIGITMSTFTDRLPMKMSKVFRDTNVSKTSASSPVSIRNKYALYRYINGHGDKLGFMALDHHYNLRSVTLNYDVIDKCAVRFCVNLSNVQLGCRTHTIKESAFEGCTSLSSIVLPTELKSCSKTAFIGCKNLTCVVSNYPIALRNGVTSIPHSKSALLLARQHHFISCACVCKYDAQIRKAIHHFILYASRHLPVEMCIQILHYLRPFEMYKGCIAE